MEGFIIETTRKDVNAPSGRSTLRWIAIAATAHEALRQIDNPTARVVEVGAEVLARAREMGVQDNDVEQLR